MGESEKIFEACACRESHDWYPGLKLIEDETKLRAAARLSVIHMTRVEVTARDTCVAGEHHIHRKH
jgi:hypothetical protein